MKIIRPHLLPLAALLVLLTLTAVSSFLRLGVGNLVTTLTVSALKMGVIAVFFMELRRAGGLIRLAALVGLVWLMILLVLALADYFTRFPGKLLG